MLDLVLTPGINPVPPACHPGWHTFWRLPKASGQIEQAEKVIKEFCSGQIRVRHHDNLARIEVSQVDIPTLAAPENARRIHSALKQLGFNFVTLVLAGYRSGSMNEMLGEVSSRR